MNFILCKGSYTNNCYTPVGVHGDLAFVRMQKSKLEKIWGKGYFIIDNDHKLIPESFSGE